MEGGGVGGRRNVALLPAFVSLCSSLWHDVWFMPISKADFGGWYFIYDLPFSLLQKDYTCPILQNGHLLNLPLINKCLYYKKTYLNFLLYIYLGIAILTGCSEEPKCSLTSMAVPKNQSVL